MLVFRHIDEHWKICKVFMIKRFWRAIIVMKMANIFSNFIYFGNLFLINFWIRNFRMHKSFYIIIITLIYIIIITVIIFIIIIFLKFMSKLTLRRFYFSFAFCLIFFHNFVIDLIFFLITINSLYCSCWKIITFK